MRLFFALWPDNSTRAALRGKARSLLSRGVGHEIHPAHYHVTLKFIGNVSRVRYAQLCAGAERVAMEPLRLRVDISGGWPDAGIMWLGAERVPDALKALVRNLDKMCGECGVARRVRPFVPHVTIARRVEQPVAQAAIWPVQWVARDFVLVASQRGPSGSRYQVLHRFGAQ